MKKFLPLLAMMTFSVQAGPVWLTMSSSILGQIQSSLPKNAIVDSTDPSASLLQVDTKDIAQISNTIHSSLNRCGGFVAHESKSEAVGSIQRLNFWNGRKNIPQASYEIKATALLHPMMEQVSEIHIQSMIEKLSSFKTRFHKAPEGRLAVDQIAAHWKALSKLRSDITVELFEHRRTPQPSVILTIRGSTLPDEIVILGAHADSISSDDHAPGADDNASGISSVTEVLRLMIENNIQPQRTVKLIAYAAEEIGLVGSSEIAQRFKREKKNVVGVLQLDMTLYKGTEDKDIMLVSDFTHKRQNEFLGKLIDEYVKVPWGYTRCGYGCSDHAAWTDQGFPASFPFEAAFEDHNPAIHTEADTLESAGGNVEHALPFVRLGLAFVTEMSL